MWRQSVWRQGESAKQPLKPSLKPTLKRHASSTRLILRLRRRRQSYRQSDKEERALTDNCHCLRPLPPAYCHCLLLLSPVPCPLSPASCLLSHTRSKKNFPGGVDVAGGVCYITPPCHGKGGCSSRPLRQEPAVPPRRGLTDVARFATFSNRRKGGLVL